MKFRKYLISMFIILVILSLTLFISKNVMAKNYSDYNQELETNLIPNGSEAIHWTMKDVLTGTNKQFSNYAGEIIILDFFNTACDPCETQTEQLKYLKNSYGSDITIMSMDTDPATDTEALIIEYAEFHNINWLIFIDETGFVSNYYDVVGVPTIYIIDQDQRVYYSHEGITLNSTMASRVEILLDNDDNNPSTTTEYDPPSVFWNNNWYWFLLGGVVLIIATGIFVQRRRVIKHNEEARMKELELKKKRKRRRKR